ncbi:hypothetical protein CHUAL_012549 [Chamberlinius hualienensis]
METTGKINKGYNEEQKKIKSFGQEKRKTEEVNDDELKKKPKISFGFSKTPSSSTSEVTSRSKKIEEVKAKQVTKPNSALAKAFNDEDDDVDEMPPEAKMRMRNVGRDTPTSCGPNSFGKTKQGFCDNRSGGGSTSKLPNASKVTKKP